MTLRILVFLFDSRSAPEFLLSIKRFIIENQNLLFTVLEDNRNANHGEFNA